MSPLTTGLRSAQRASPRCRSTCHRFGRRILQPGLRTLRPSTLRRVTPQQVKFYHAVFALSTEVVAEFYDVVDAPHETTPCDHHKTTVLHRTSVSVRRRLPQFPNEEQLGDWRPPRNASHFKTTKTGRLHVRAEDGNAPFRGNYAKGAAVAAQSRAGPGTPAHLFSPFLHVGSNSEDARSGGRASHVVASSPDFSLPLVADSPRCAGGSDPAREPSARTGREPTERCVERAFRTALRRKRAMLLK
ncbi:hypothetical protein HPB50_019635 [Hyalomma asiaticum]|uniref:Uncharacterized protein n=1 Tax=Hyalomma asiaticum TaxID=266040 RepID=A0ACB7TRN0_HYAAI|nr:hypothetical protein HPB50_019635 [Hyalomma asiaticum]